MTTEQINTQIANAPQPVHLVALSGCHTLAEKIRYACEHNRPDPTTAVVQEWLARYHVSTDPGDVFREVGAWRTENALSPLPTEDERGLVVRPEPAGVTGFYIVAVLSMLVSIDTSWRFFGDVLGITDTRERLVMFTVLEVALIACGYGMRANVVRSGRPGAPRWVAWVLCGMAGYMAWQLSGVAAGIARVALGPVLGLVMLHLALGIEIRAGQHKITTWARIGRELRERVLSRLGLSDDERDALARTRDRAARRVARLSLAGWVPFRSARVARALRASNVAHDPAARDRMLAELATIRHAAGLARLDQPSPWPTIGQSVIGAAARSVNVPVNATVTTAAAVVNGHAVGERRPRTTGAARTPSRRGPTRRKLADYLAQAREQHQPGVRVSPAWVRGVIPDCPRSTSKSVADALNAHLATDNREVSA